MADDAPTFSARTAALTAGITYRQLDYWARTDLVRPSAVDAAGSGSRRRYSIADVRLLLIIRTMLDYGAALPLCRRVIDELAGLRPPEQGEWLAIGADGSCTLVWGVEQLPSAVCLVIDLAQVVATDEALTEVAASFVGPAVVGAFTERHT
jgi:DNA-binding transcriptional MerR regulator